MPVAQKRHPTGHPTWEEMHRVRRVLVGIRTDSTFSPSGRLQRYLRVPSEEVCTTSVVRRWRGNSVSSRWRSGTGSSVAALQLAAGVIHSDIERGFIRAELIGYDALMEAGTWNAAKEKGTLRLEGKEYTMQDGDIINVRFNV